MEYKDIVNIVKTIRKYQELSGSQDRTQKIVLEYLKRFYSNRIKTYNLASGLVVCILGDIDNKVIAYQVEVNALPFFEKYNVENKSVEEGVMVSHGNEIHLAIALGLISDILNYNFRCNFCFIFESSNKGITNIKELLSNTVLNRLNIDEVYGIRIDPNLYTNQIIVQGGCLFACIDTIDIIINRIDNYISFLNSDINVLIIASEFIKNIKNIVNYKESKLLLKFNIDNSVDYTNTNIHTKYVQGIIRSIDSKEYNLFKLRINALRLRFEKKYNCSISIEYNKTYPSVINDYSLARKFVNHIKNYQTYELLTRDPYMYADKFGLFTDKYKGLMLMIGAESIFPFLHETMLPKEFIIKKVIDTFTSYFYENHIK